MLKQLSPQEKARILVPYSLDEIVGFFQTIEPHKIVTSLYGIAHVNLCESSSEFVCMELKGLEHALYLGLDEKQRKEKEGRIIDETASMHQKDFRFSDPLVEEYAKVVALRGSVTMVNWQYLLELLGQDELNSRKNYYEKEFPEIAKNENTFSPVEINILTQGKNPLSDVDKRPKLLERIQRLYETLYDCAVFQSSGKQVHYPTPQEWQLTNLQEWRYMKFQDFNALFTGNETDGLFKLQRIRRKRIKRLLK